MSVAPVVERTTAPLEVQSRWVLRGRDHLIADFETREASGQGHTAWHVDCDGERCSYARLALSGMSEVIRWGALTSGTGKVVEVLDGFVTIQFGAPDAPEQLRIDTSGERVRYWKSRKGAEPLVATGVCKKDE